MGLLQLCGVCIVQGFFAILGIQFLSKPKLYLSSTTLAQSIAGEVVALPKFPFLSIAIALPYLPNVSFNSSRAFSVAFYFNETTQTLLYILYIYLNVLNISRNYLVFSLQIVVRAV